MEETTVTKPEPRKTVPVEKFIPVETAKQRLAYTLSQSGWRDLEGMFKSRWGFTQFEFTKGKTRFLVWDRPTYRLFVNEKKGWRIEIPVENANEDAAADALHLFLTDMGMEKETMLKGSEIANLKKLALTTIGDASLELPHLSDAGLRTFVDDYVSNRIFTHYHLREPNLMGSVFMVFMFMKTEQVVLDAIAKVMPSPGLRPEKENPPTSPDHSLKDFPTAPPDPKLETADPERVEMIKREIDWTVMSPSKLDEYLAEIKARNDKALTEHAEAKATWVAACDKMRQDHDAEYEAYKKALEEHTQKMAALESLTAAWEIEQAKYSIVSSTIDAHFMRTIGCVWEFYDKAGPRSINGYPMFFSCHFLHSDDWKRAAKAIDKEMKRREKLKV